MRCYEEEEGDGTAQARVLTWETRDDGKCPEVSWRKKRGEVKVPPS